MAKLYGEDKFIDMLGGLHIEMVRFNILGNILRDIRWTNAHNEADFMYVQMDLGLDTRIRKLHVFCLNC